METWSIINPPDGTMMMPTVDVSQITRKYLDLTYADQSPSQKLDIYLPPEGDGPFPTIIFIHGGAFIMGDKRDVQLLQAIDGINRGYAVVSVEYRLAGEARYPAALFDTKAAIRFLRANASEYKLDGRRFALYGDSAGGHYVVMAAATQGNPAFEDFSMGNDSCSSAVQVVASRFGVYDFALEKRASQTNPPTADTNWDKYERQLLGTSSDEIIGLLHFTNPLNFIDKDFPPIFVQHGSDDKTVPVIHSYLLVDKIRTVCGQDRVKVDILDGYDHGGIDARWNQKENDDIVFDFFDKQLL